MLVDREPPLISSLGRNLLLAEQARAQHRSVHSAGGGTAAGPLSPGARPQRLLLAASPGGGRQHVQLGGHVQGPDGADAGHQTRARHLSHVRKVLSCYDSLSTLRLETAISCSGPSDPRLFTLLENDEMAQAAHHVSEALRYSIQYYKDATAGLRTGFGMGYGPGGPGTRGGKRTGEVAMFGGGHSRPPPKYPRH